LGDGFKAKKLLGLGRNSVHSAMRDTAEKLAAHVRLLNADENSK
jgi:hypothetical protein